MSDDIENKIQKMAAFSQTLTSPDGGVAKSILPNDPTRGSDADTLAKLYQTPMEYIWAVMLAIEPYDKGRMEAARALMPAVHKNQVSRVETAITEVPEAYAEALKFGTREQLQARLEMLEPTAPKTH